MFYSKRRTMMIMMSCNLALVCFLVGICDVQTEAGQRAREMAFINVPGDLPNQLQQDQLNIANQQQGQLYIANQDQAANGQHIANQQQGQLNIANQDQAANGQHIANQLQGQLNIANQGQAGQLDMANNAPGPVEHSCNKVIDWLLAALILVALTFGSLLVELARVQSNHELARLGQGNRTALDKWQPKHKSALEQWQSKNEQVKTAFYGSAVLVYATAAVSAFGLVYRKCPLVGQGIDNAGRVVRNAAVGAANAIAGSARAGMGALRRRFWPTPTAAVAEIEMVKRK